MSSGPIPHVPTRKGQTKTQRLAYQRMLLNLRELQDETEVDYMIRDLVPDAWDTLELDLDVEEPKDKITLRLDRSVAQFYRAMGRGYHARINRILATYAQMRIAEVRHLEALIERDDAKRAERGQ